MSFLKGKTAIITGAGRAVLSDGRCGSIGYGIATAYAKEGAVAVMALQAGNDMVITTDYRTQIPAVIAAVQEGTLAESVIDSACLRVLKCKDDHIYIPSLYS